MRLLPCLIALLLGLAAGPALAQAAAPSQAEQVAGKPRPRIALVLSGGGARGLAHIGVLRVLQELRVPVDMVVGTSMGALVGGAFASGRRVDELEAFVNSADWTAILADRPPRQELSYRRREDDQLVPSRIEVGLGLGEVSLPPAAAGNSGLEFALERLIASQYADLSTGQLPLPFRAIATDLLTGELADLADTPLFLAMRASMAIPGFFSPVRVKGRLMVDGGLVRNMGVETARAMGADLIIAVDVGTPLAEEKELGSALGVSRQMLAILTTQNVARSIRTLKPEDVLIDPDLGNLSFLDFGRRDEAVATGQRAARAAQERLRPLALSAEEYALHEQRRQRPPVLAPQALPLASLEIEGAKLTNPEVLKKEIDLALGQPASQAQINAATSQLYGRGDFDRLDTQVLDRDGERHVTIHVSEAEWARSRLRLGLELSSNFADDNSFKVVGLHRLSWLNAWGGELRTQASLGSQRKLASALYQPLGAGSPWYVEPGLAVNGEVLDSYVAGKRVARYNTNYGVANLTLGRRLGQWGDVQLGYSRFSGEAVVQIPEQSDKSPVQQSGRQGFLRLRADTLDSLAFPTRGYLLDLTASHTQIFNTGESSTDVSFAGLAAYRADSWAGHVWGELSHASFGAATSLGGFLRLSGSPKSSLSDQNVGLLRLVSAKRIGTMPVGLGETVRGGFSLELGGAVPNGQRLQPSDLKLAGSLFIAVDTRLGPFFLAAGATRGVDSAVYLFLGPSW
ncbi:patatin domain-containing protein [Paucibacter sp. KBW04]|uniref:patatin-like phospholipase family protein n=1 Tax=Paucibacter sp. KBW04 TaxID=2153361 RepID=UPI000F56FAD8|nr:patatin-like phospholipase family protein [Paucibacter sp. KBW04]RQO63337.1 patatin domain-containing protein [Paucibacter sp. KBW04]